MIAACAAVAGLPWMGFAWIGGAFSLAIIGGTFAIFGRQWWEHGVGVGLLTLALCYAWVAGITMGVWG